MTLLEILNVTTGGVRSALALLGVMTLLVVWHTPRPEERAELYKNRTVMAFTTSCIIFSPAHAAALLDHPFPGALARLLDLTSTGLGCAALIYLLASRAVQRGVPMFRVKRAMLANSGVVLGFVLVAWAVR